MRPDVAVLDTMSLPIAPPAMPGADHHGDTAARPAPRRTYGRQRPVSPIADAPTLFSHTTVATEPEASAAKGLLSRWATASTTWRDSLAFLDAPEDADDDVEVAKAAMERMRREARGAASPRARDDPLEGENVDKEEASVQGDEVREQDARVQPNQANSSRLQTSRLCVNFSSSSLTALSTSPPASSPARSRILNPLGPATSMEEETMPIRKAGASKASGRVRRVITSSDDEEDPRQGSPSTSRTRRDTLSPLEDVDIIPEKSSTSTFGPLRPAETTRQSTADSEDDDAPDDLQKFLSNLAEEDNQPEEEREKSTESIYDPKGLLDNEESVMERNGKPEAKGRALKVIT